MDNVNLIVLTNGTILISQLDKVSVADIGDPEYQLTNPFVVENSDLILSPWLMDYTRKTKFRIGSDKIITMTDPNSNLLKKYDSLTNNEGS